jgi:cytochrome c peroxidase
MLCSHIGGMSLHRRFIVALVVFPIVGIFLCARGIVPVHAAQTESTPQLSDLAVLGKKIFFDPSLSASGRVACATCHSPTHAYGPPNGLAVQLGGSHLDRQGTRAVPSLRYVLNRTPSYSRKFVENASERLIEGNDPPKGGFGWDGRFNTLREQAAFPLLAANEMANASPADVAAKLRDAAYAVDFRKLFGAQVFDDPVKAYARALEALERFELEDSSFHPYSSKYDDYLDGKVELSEQERRGLALFDDPKRGNCASCHVDRKGADGSHPLFTDYEFEALGVPRNPEILANADPGYYDMGLCGPLRTDIAKQSENCGLFKTPTLRNVATRTVFFHNGRFHTLREALRFYARRDTDPQLWYSVSRDGAVVKFDDLPSSLRENVDVLDEPLTRKQGAEPVWNDAEIDDVIAFLRTLSDRDTLTASSRTAFPR